MQISLSSVSSIESGWLEEALHKTFGEVDRSFLEAMKPELDWVRLSSGDVLFQQGEQEDALYFLVAGRLRASVVEKSGGIRTLGDIRRGETLGEMGLLTGEPRSARVVAVRDSLLVRLSRESYLKVIRVYPLVSVHVARVIVERVKRANDPRLSWSRPATIAVLPVTRGANCPALIAELLPSLRRHGTVDCIDARRLALEFGANSMETNKGQAGDNWGVVSRWIDGVEATSDLCLLTSDDPDSTWTLHCLRHADEIIWVADTDTGDELLKDSFAGFGLPKEHVNMLTRQTLLLSHAPDRKQPKGTSSWLQRFPVDNHLHLRRGHKGDLGRIARTLMGRSIGLVFGGGGARGFAHLGVLKALEEAGITVDRLGGCSIGSVKAGYAAFDLPADEVIALARKAFAKSPTGDINPVPLLSLIQGKQLRTVIDSAVQALTGFDANIEDTWKPLYCIASNYSRAEETIPERGNLARAVRASVSIPAALPPVIIDGDLMIDGGTFNNFPTDVMARKGAGTILGCDLMRENLRRIDLEETPSSAALAIDRLRPRSKRRYRLPALSSMILNVSILHSQSKLAASRAHADVCFTPDLGRIGMLEWTAFDKAVEAGYEHARLVIAELPDSVRQSLIADSIA